MSIARNSWIIKGARPLGGPPTDLYVESGALVDAAPAKAQAVHRPV